MADEQPQPVSVPTLIMTGGPLDGTAYALDFTGREAVIGSSLDADVQILLGNVESFHARIAWESGALVISDGGSATGTFVNGEKLEADHPLEDGDRICLGPPGAKGSAKLVVRLPGSTSTPAPAHAAAEQPAQPTAAAPTLFLGGEEGETPPAFNLATPEPALASDHAVPDEDTSTVAFVPAEAADDLFLAPAKSPAPQPAPPPEPVSALPPPAASKPAIAPPPPPPSSAPRPAPAPAAESAPAPERLTAPPPPPPPSARRPEYRMELPSIPVTRPAESQPGPAPFPSLRRPTPAPSKKGRATARKRRAVSLPSFATMAAVVGGALAVALVGYLVWNFGLRQTPPTLTALAPQQAEAGRTLTLSGTGFAKNPAANTVRIGNSPAQVTSASPIEISVVVPPQAGTQLPVTVETKGGRSNTLTVNVLPTATVTALDPDVAMPGQTILIKGDGFAGQRLSVKVAGIESPSVEQVPGGIRAAVPELPLPQGSNTNVVVQAGSSPPRTFALMIGRLPLLTEASPKAGPIGLTVTLKGRGFSADASANHVTFGTRPALVVSATSTSLSVVAPAPPVEELQPDFPITVEVGGQSSGGATSYTYIRSASSSFLPHFFAAPVTEFPADNLAFVSTELGPFLVLGNAGGASAAARAVDAAGALNARVQAAATRDLEFELRERPEPAVAVAGEPRPVLVATAGDATAYSKAWQGERGAARGLSPLMVARHWTALLQDYFGLFLQGKRPLQMISVSSYGQVLTEIWSEARRREPNGRGVATGIVVPPSTARAAALRSMALVLAADASRASAAVEGRWEGTIEDEDRGPRRFRVVVRKEGGRLAGTVTTWQGSIELTAQLREVAYQQGTLRFTADLQGAANRFEGKLAGTTVSGSVTRPGRTPGRFTIEYSE